MDSRCMTLVGLVVTLTGAILLPPAAYAQINSAAQDKNGYHIYVEVQGFVSGNHVTGFSWDSQANCSNGGNSNCPNSNGTGIAIYALWDWYVNGVHYCVQNCNGFITYAQGVWSFSENANGPTGVTASEVMNQGSSGYWANAGGYVQETDLNDAGLPFF